MAPIKREGWCTNPDMSLAESIPLPFSSSMRSLLELKKAISIPEKNADDARVKAIIR
jgi:hypothetical protein